jgi:histidinol-phosphate aminotransferase
VARILAEREQLMEALKEFPHLRPYPSQANFILCRVVGRDARAFKETLAACGVLIRYYDSPGLTDHVRFSVGTPEETERLIREMRML